MDDRHNEVLAVAFLFLILAWITVSLRVYVRVVMMKTWGIDDAYMAATLLFFTVYIASQIVAAVHGTGRHRWDLSDEDARIALKYWYLCELLYVLANCLLKFSIGYFYLRVAAERVHIWIIRLLMVGTVFFGLVYFFLVLLQCLPIREFWENHPASSKCLPKGPTLGITYALAAVNAAADCALGIIPIFIVWNLEMKRKTKFMVGGLLAFAAVGCAGTIARMFYIKTLMDGPDFLYSTTDVAIWSTVEPGIGITASSMATLRPLVKQYLWRFGLTTSPRGRTPTYSRSPSGQKVKVKGKRGYRRSISPSDLVPTKGTTNTEIYADSVPPPEYEDRVLVSLPTIIVEDSPSSSLESGISQTFTVEQEIEDAPQVHLRDSFRYNFARGTIISLSRLRQRDHEMIPDVPNVPDVPDINANEHMK